MKLFMYCLLLPFATMVVTAAPIRARRDNVLNFLSDALETSTEKTTPANTTANQNLPDKPVTEQDSEETANSFTDNSEEKSTESFDTSGLTDAAKSLDSDETVNSKDVEKDEAPPRKKPDVGLKDVSSQLVQDQQGSGELSGPHQADRERTRPNSEEGMMADENLSGAQVVHLSGDQVTGSLQRKATPGRVHGVSGVLAPGSREHLDRDSWEDNDGRRAPVGNRGDPDYDETREFISSETYPVENAPSSQTSQTS